MCVQICYKMTIKGTTGSGSLFLNRVEANERDINSPYQTGCSPLKEGGWYGMDLLQLFVWVAKMADVFRNALATPEQPALAAIRFFIQWYEAHRFEALDVTLVCVADDRTNPHKTGIMLLISI